MRLFQRMGALLPGARRQDAGPQDPAPTPPSAAAPPAGSAEPAAALPEAERPLPPEILAIMAELAQAPEAPAAEPEPWAEPAPWPAPPPAPPERPAGALPAPTLEATAEIAGFLGSCLVDAESGLLLASEGGADLDLEAVAALNTQVVRAERDAVELMGLDDRIEDILVTMGRRLHLIRPIERMPGLFLFVALDKKAANLGMARMQLSRIEGGLAL